MATSDYEALAKNVVRRSLHIQPKENVIVECWNHGLDAAKEVVYQLRAVGARPMLLLEDVKRLNTRNADVVVLSACVQMQSLAAVALAEAALGLPVTSTAICTARRMLDHLGLVPVVPQAGALLSERFAEARVV